MIQRFQRIHYLLSDLQRFHLSLARSTQAMLDLVDFSLDALDRHRALFQSPQQPRTQLFLVERLPTAILFDNPWQNQLGGLVSGESLSTTQALSAPTHLRALCHQTRIDHFGFVSAAERTVHNNSRC